MNRDQAVLAACYNARLMTMFETFLFTGQGRPFGLRSPAFHMLAALVVCSLVAVCAHQLGARSQGEVQQMQAELIASTRQNALPGLLPPAAQTPAHEAAPWPLRQTVDEVVQQASQEALRAGVGVRSLSVSHQSASPAAWGRVNLEVSASGGYAALKAWQASLSQRFPALAVQNLRLQAVPGSPAGLEAQWTWVLHVRD